MGRLTSCTHARTRKLRPFCRASEANACTPDYSHKPISLLLFFPQSTLVHPSPPERNPHLLKLELTACLSGHEFPMGQCPWTNNGHVLRLGSRPNRYSFRRKSLNANRPANCWCCEGGLRILSAMLWAVVVAIVAVVVQLSEVVIVGSRVCGEDRVTMVR